MIANLLIVAVLAAGQTNRHADFTLQMPDGWTAGGAEEIQWMKHLSE